LLFERGVFIQPRSNLFPKSLTIPTRGARCSFELNYTLRESPTHW